MARFDFVHTKFEDAELIIIPLKRTFGDKTQTEQMEMVEAFQRRAAVAGVNGAVIPVWNGGGGGALLFLAPERFHAFMRSIDFEWVAANINKSLQWESTLF